jgi:penicillin amidase
LPLTTFAAGRLSHLIELIHRRPEGWFAQGWPAELVDALATVVRRLRAEHGSDRSAWAYGTLRQLTLEHPIGRIPQLASVFNRGPYVFGGDGTTISQAGSTALKPLGNPTAIASLRAVIDVGNWEASRFILPGGQSGNPMSPHYDDMIPLWLRGEGVPIAFSPLEVGFAAKHTLRLMPLP